MRSTLLVSASTLLACASAAALAPCKWCVVGGGPHGVHIAARLLSEAPGATPANLRIVDDEPTLLHKWKTRTAATGMRYLRSSASNHLDVDLDDLRRYARATGRGQEVFAPDYARPRPDGTFTAGQEWIAGQELIAATR